MKTKAIEIKKEFVINWIGFLNKATRKLEEKDIDVYRSAQMQQDILHEYLEMLESKLAVIEKEKRN